jgi:hypothetical protein
MPGSIEVGNLTLGNVLETEWLCLNPLFSIPRYFVSGEDAKDAEKSKAKQVKSLTTEATK